VSDIIEKIKAHKIIPVLGYELYNGHPSLEVGGKPEENFLKWFSHKLIEEGNRFGNAIAGKLSIDYPCCFDYVNECYDALISKEKYTSFGGHILRVYNKYLRTMPVPVSIVKLARIECFRFYIDTTIFNFLERAITTYRLSKSIDKKNYAVLKPDNMKSDSPFMNPYATPIDSLQPLKRITKPVIWDFFGSCKEKENIINMANVYMQEVLFNYIKDHDKSGYEDLRTVFKESGFLILGCSFRDWIFRFILRLLAFDKLEKGNSNLQNQFVIDELLSRDADPSRNMYITDSGIYSLKNIPPNALIDIIFSRLTDSCVIKEGSTPTGLVFISFVGENRELAKKIYKFLTEQWALDCFLDEENLHGGEKLNDKIVGAIDNCSVFVPIVSAQLDIAADRKSFIFPEWQYAITKKEPLVIMPVYTRDYDLSLLLKIKGEAYKDIQPILFKSNLGGVADDEADRPLTDFFCRQLLELQYNCKIK